MLFHRVKLSGWVKRRDRRKKKGGKRREESKCQRTETDIKQMSKDGNGDNNYH